MNFFKSLLIALSTYSTVPVPQFEWSEKNMKYSICFFPIVGILCGGLLYLWYVLCNALGISSFFFASVSVCIPLLVTGGIHIDGYMDTVDALSSHQSRERKLEILKDTHCGAFSVLYCIAYLLLNLGLVYELYEYRSIIIICPVFVLSRALSALCAVNMPNARKSGMLNSYTEKTSRKTVNIVMAFVILLTVGVMVFLLPIVGGIAVGFGFISVFLYYRIAMTQFGGATGDTAGFFLQICELSCMIGAWIGVLII